MGATPSRPKSGVSGWDSAIPVCLFFAIAWILLLWVTVARNPAGWQGYLVFVIPVCAAAIAVSSYICLLRLGFAPQTAPAKFFYGMARFFVLVMNTASIGTVALMAIIFGPILVVTGVGTGNLANVFGVLFLLVLGVNVMWRKYAKQ